MTRFKSLLTYAPFGFILGAALASWIAPGIIGWWFSPATGAQAMCSCLDTAHSTSSKLITAQLMGGGAGMLAFLAVGLLVTKKKAVAS